MQDLTYFNENTQNYPLLPGFILLSLSGIVAKHNQINIRIGRLHNCMLYLFMIFADNNLTSLSSMLFYGEHTESFG